MPGGSGSRALIGAGAVSLISIVLLASLVPAVSGQRPQRGEARLIFESQASDGTTVEISRLNSSEGGFIVLYEEAFIHGEVFESLRGASSYLEPGPHRNVTARFDEPLERTRTILAVFHKDTNGNRSLDVAETRGAEDAPYQGASGAVFDMADVRVEEASQSPGPGPVLGLLALALVALAGRRWR